MLFIRRAVICTVAILLLGISASVGASDTDSAEIMALRRDVDTLRAVIAEQDRRLKELEARGGSAQSTSPVVEAAQIEEAPSPEELGGPVEDAAAMPEPTYSAAAIPSAGGSQGAQAKIGVVFDGIYTGGRRVPEQAEVRAVELNIGAPIDPYFDLFGKFTFAPDEVDIENGYVTGHLPWNLQARLGKEWVPFGDVGTLDVDEHPQVDQPHVIAQFLGAEGLKATGAHIEWLAPFANPTLTLIVGAYDAPAGDANTAATDKGGDGNPDVTDMFLDEGAFNVRDNKRGPLLFGRISSYIDWNESRHALRLGGSWARDENDASGATRTTVSGLDAKYRWRPDATGRGITLGGEYLVHHREESPTTALLVNGGNHLTANGGYVYGQYDFDRRWGLGYRYDNTNTVFSSTNEITSNSVYGEFRPTEFSRIRAQYRHDDRNFDADGNGLTDDDADVYMLQFTHLIGWHPAHKY